MYKLVIADDELLIRESLSSLIEWEKLGFEIVGLFSDGQEVLDFLEYMSADVILTDIKMLYVSGMDVAQYVYENELACKVLFISGHQEFDLALQGIKYGVSDYLLKPTNLDLIETTFAKIKNELDIYEERTKFEEDDKQRFEEMLPIIKDKFFSDLILGVIESNDQIARRMKLIYPEVNLQTSFCILADISIKDYEAFMKDKWKYSIDQLEANILNFINIHNQNLSLNIIYKSNNMFEFFGILTDINENSEKTCIDEFMTFIDNITQIFKFDVEYEIKHIFKNIFEVAEYRENISINKQVNDVAYLREQKRLIVSNINNHNIAAAQKIFHSILDGIVNADFVWRNNFIIDILSVINEVVKNMDENLADEIQSYINYSVIVTMKSMDEIKAYCDKIFDKIRTATVDIKIVNSNILVTQAQEYIKNHITEDILQEQVADKLYISTAYLCRILKKHLNENFIQYVTRMKIEKAIELLKDPKYKSYQIGEVLGYKTPKYFSKLFKQQTGMSPIEYRSKILNLDGAVDENS